MVPPPLGDIPVLPLLFPAVHSKMLVRVLGLTPIKGQGKEGQQTKKREGKEK